MLSYSRGALIAGLVGLAVWFVLVPMRLRATLLLGLGAIGGAVASAWAIKHSAITGDNIALAARTSAGHEYGAVLVGVIVLMVIAGLTAAYGLERIEVAEPVRRRIGTALIVCVAMVPVVAVGAMAASSRGLTGEISHVWNDAHEREQRTAPEQRGAPRRARQQPAAVLERGAQGRRARAARRRRRRRLRHGAHPLQHEHARGRPRPQLPDRDVRRLRADRDRGQPRAAGGVGLRGGANAGVRDAAARPGTGGERDAGAANEMSGNGTPANGTPQTAAGAHAGERRRGPRRERHPRPRDRKRRRQPARSHQPMPLSAPA